MTRLGCPQDYDVAIHARCGAQTIIGPSVLKDAITRLEWDRRLNETSEATVELTLTKANPECCTELGTIEPGMHELTIYRDGALVWQGPVTTTTKDNDRFVIEAQDVSAYLARLVNATTVGMAVDYNKYVSDLARRVIVENLNDTRYSCPADYPCLTSYISIQRAGPRWRMKRTSIWVAYVLDIIDELAELGFEWTAVGRTFVIRPERTEKDRPQSTLQAGDLSGQVSVVRSWDDLATHVWATTQTEDKAGRTVVVTGKKCSPYGRRDLLTYQNPPPGMLEKTEADRKIALAQLEKERDARLKAVNDAYKVRSDKIRSDAQKAIAAASTEAQKEQIRKKREEDLDDARQDRDDQRKAIADQHRENVRQMDRELTAEQEAAIDEMLRDIARHKLKGRYPVPVSFRVNDGATLQPTAPITVEQLVPGERVDVLFSDRCRTVMQSMRLIRLTVQWDAAGEKVAVSFAPLAVAIEDDTPNRTALEAL